MANSPIGKATSLSATTAVVPVSGVLQPAYRVFWNPPPTYYVQGELTPRSFIASIGQSLVSGGPYTYNLTSQNQPTQPLWKAPGHFGDHVYVVVRYGVTGSNPPADSISDELDILLPNSEAVNGPLAPSSVAAVPVSGVYGSMSVSWVNNSSIVSDYRVDYKKHSDPDTAWVTVIAAAIATSQVIADLLLSTSYDFRVYVRSTSGILSTKVSVTASTAAGRALPGAPTAIIAQPLDEARIAINFLAGTPYTATSYSVRRGTVTTGPYTEVGTVVGAGTSDTGVQQEFIDTGLDPDATYFYVVRGVNESGNGSLSVEATATTAARPTNVGLSPGAFTFHPDSDNRIFSVLGRTFYTSNMDRWVVRTTGGFWFKAGLKRQLEAPVLADGGGSGSIEAGKYRVYTMLYRTYDEERSAPSDASNVITLAASHKLTVTPQNDSTKVTCRDIGYDISGAQIDGCDYWEVYIAAENSAYAYLVSQLPLTTLSATINIRNIEIFTPARRTMETGGQYSLPPACAIGVFKGTHVWATGEKTIGPSDTEKAGGAILSIGNGDHDFDITNYSLPEGTIYHEVWIGGRPTGWEVWDTEGNIGYIRHSDPDINKSGFNQAGGTFTDFKFVPGNRVYLSAYYSGLAGGAINFSPETFPPSTIYQNELYPDDNASINAMISLGDSIFLSKPSKWIVASGGDDPDVPAASFEAVSTTSGCLAPKTVCVDRRNIIYYLGDTGVHRVTTAGVERVTDFTGNAHLFQDLFEIDSVPAAIGIYFAREEWAVFCGLNKIGNTGNLDGLIYDTRTNAILPFSLDRRITALNEQQSEDGDYKIIFGDALSNSGELFQQGIYVDGTNYTQINPAGYSTTIRGYVTSGVIDTEHSLTIREGQVRFRHNQAGAGYRCALIAGGGNRTGIGRTFQPRRRVEFLSNDTRDRVDFGGNYVQQGAFKFEFETNKDVPSLKASWSEINVGVITRGGS